MSWRPRGARRDGALDAFRAEALSFVDVLHGAALRLTHHPAEANDLVAGVYQELFGERAAPVRGERLKVDMLRRLHTLRRRHTEARTGPADPSPRPAPQIDRRRLGALERRLEAGLAARLDAAAVREAIDSLPAELRPVIWLRDVERLSYTQLATVLDLPPATVDARLSQARQTLFRVLTDRAAALARLVDDAAS